MYQFQHAFAENVWTENADPSRPGGGEGSRVRAWCSLGGEGVGPVALPPHQVTDDRPLALARDLFVENHGKAEDSYSSHAHRRLAACMEVGIVSRSLLDLDESIHELCFLPLLSNPDERPVDVEVAHAREQEVCGPEQPLPVEDDEPYDGAPPPGLGGHG